MVSVNEGKINIMEDGEREKKREGFFITGKLSSSSATPLSILDHRRKGAYARTELSGVLIAFRLCNRKMKGKDKSGKFVVSDHSPY